MEVCLPAHGAVKSRVAGVVKDEKKTVVFTVVVGVDVGQIK